MDKKEAQKSHILDPLTYCVAYLRVYSKYSNRAVTLIQQSRISSTLIEQSPHIAYAITKKTKQTSILILKGSRDLNDKKL